MEDAVAVAAGRVSADKDADKEARDAAEKHPRQPPRQPQPQRPRPRRAPGRTKKSRLLTRAWASCRAAQEEVGGGGAGADADGDECVAMVKHGLAAGKFSAAAAGGSFTVPAKRAGNVVIKDAATSRETSFTDVEVKLVGEAAKVLAPSTAATAATNDPLLLPPLPRPPRKRLLLPSPRRPRTPRPGPRSRSWRWCARSRLTGKSWAPSAGRKWRREVPGQSAAACLRRFKELKAAVKSTKKEG